MDITGSIQCLDQNWGWGSGSAVRFDLRRLKRYNYRCLLLLPVLVRSGSVTAIRFPQGSFISAIVLNGETGTDEDRMEKSMWFSSLVGETK